MLTNQPGRCDANFPVVPDNEDFPVVPDNEDFPVVPDTEDFVILVRMSYTDPELAVLSVRGVPDSDSASALSRLLSPSFLANLAEIVLDLSKVPFLGVHGLELASQAQTYARQHNVSFSVVHGSGSVEHALSNSGLDTTIPCFPTLTAARSAGSTRPMNQA